MHSKVNQIVAQFQIFIYNSYKFKIIRLKKMSTLDLKGKLFLIATSGVITILF
jgi:hypothetical protein